MILTVADIEARTGQVYEDTQLDQVNAFITDVTALVEDFLGRVFTPTSPAPAGVRGITAREVIRYLNEDPGVAADRVGDLSTSYAHQGAVVVLSADTVTQLRRYKRRSGIGSIQLVSRYIPDTTVDDGSGA
ncbi:hypothetical protein [Nonomuraea sp. NPDC049129]|uniref:hypothetical protein n=1 Tax=Nonomuraea sp. NPDC049129 TaxID=3155272 RepID=UPI0033D95DEE